jgi:cytochrome c-type biogenesis protein CcmH/NrfG
MRLTLLTSLLLLAQGVMQGCSSTAPREYPPPVVEKGQQAPVQQPDSRTTVPVQAQPRSQLQSSSRSQDTAVVSSQSPAVVALLDQAEQQANACELEPAAASLERAIRIDPRNPVLWYHLATVRLSQGDSSQAEQLAVKSNSLAAGNRTQQARNWRLIAQARREQNDTRGAATAEQRARKLDPGNP